MTYRVRPADLAAAVAGPIAPDPALPRACVIGAGPSGLAAAKALHQARIGFDCFEAGPVVGGNWVLGNPNGRSACYSTLEINTSCGRMAYSDFPMPSRYPHYARHWEVREYFERYVDHFGFRHAITFGTEVTHVRRDADGFRVELGTGEIRRYDAVLVANGHHWDPRWPEPAYRGSEDFEGEQIHVHHYREPELLRDKRVLVLGIGNSATDIAVESSRIGAKTFLAMRHGARLVKPLIVTVSLVLAAKLALTPGHPIHDMLFAGR
jgi:cation diffusion facilitator CzcD-associated flavoprotein CzcO